MVSPIVEDIYPRVPINLNADQVLDWLTGKGTKYKRRATSKLKEIAQEIGNANDLRKEIPQAKTLSEIQSYGKEIDSLQLDLPKFDLNADFRQQQRNIAEDIFREVGAKGGSLNRIVNILEDNNFNLDRLRQHAYTVKDKEVLGIWEIGTGRFITNFRTGRTVPQITETTPSFNIPDEVL